MSAQDVARLTRRPYWLLVGLSLLGKFPKKRRYRGRPLGWYRTDVLAWMSSNLSLEIDSEARRSSRMGKRPRQRCLPLEDRGCATRPAGPCLSRAVQRKPYRATMSGPASNPAAGTIERGSGGALLDAPVFLRIREVLRMTGLSRPTLYRRIAAQRFPAPVHLGGRACGWRYTALLAWIENPETYRAPSTGDTSTPRKRGRPRKYAP